MTPMPGEPHVKKYFPPADSTTHSQPPSLDVPDEVYGHAMSIERRADIGFYRHRQAILVDVTTASPMAKVVKHYIPSCAANLAVERKVKSYKKFFNIDDNSHSRLWFFAVETNGCFSREAREFCKMLSKTSSQPGSLKTIYQRLSVSYQNSIARQILKSLNYYSSPDRPSVAVGSLD